jgi:hypothetical protein
LEVEGLESRKLLSVTSHKFSVPSASPGVDTQSAVIEAVNDGPMVTSVSRFGVHAQRTTIVIGFNEPLAPGPAQNPFNYRITDFASRVYPIASAVYDPTAMTVTIQPKILLDIHRTYRLIVIGRQPTGITSSTGVFLDGAGTGQPATDFVTNITRNTLVL